MASQALMLPVLLWVATWTNLATGRSVLDVRATSLLGDDVEKAMKNNETEDTSPLNIAIVGAGASGLTLAYALEHVLGHRGRVTVFESNDRVGGKVYSPEVDGQPVDVGALWIDSPFTTMLLESVCEMPYNVTYEYTFWVPQENGVHQNLPFLAALDALGFGDYESEFPAWLRVYNRYKYLQDDPMAFFEYDKNEALYVPFDEFIKENGIEILGQAFRSIYVWYGYGFGENVPALYILKFMIRFLNPALIAPLLAGSNPQESLVLPSVVLPEGGQRLFECVASTLSDVRVNASVKEIRRAQQVSGKSMVWINTGQGEVELFDRVVVTTDLMQALSFLDVRDEEIKLFNTIQHNMYASSIVEGVNVPGFPTGNVSLDSLLFPRNLYQNRSMFPLALSTKATSAGPATMVTYQYDVSTQSRDVISTGSPDLTPILDDSSYAYLKSDAEEYFSASGIPFKNLSSQFMWATYFPHFGTEALKKGAYRKLASLQGKNGTYYAGSIFNFETILGVTEFALALAPLIR